MYPVCTPVVSYLRTNMCPLICCLFVYCCNSALAIQGARSVQSREVLE